MPTKKTKPKPRPEPELVVGPLESGRLDRYVAMRYPDWSRTRVQRLINDRLITVDDHPASPNHRLRAGQVIKVRLPVVEAPATRPVEPLPFPVLLEDESLLILDKPADLLVHPAGEFGKGTSLVDIIRPHVAASGWADGARPGLVHRLDRDTSGVIVVAKTPEAHARVAKQFANRQVKKTYTAIVRGAVEAREGTLECLMARDPSHRKRFAVAATGRLAVSQFKRLEVIGTRASVLEFYPQTGRTHQIRVQAAGFGHPVLGDHVYGPVDPRFSFVPRHMLHAHHIEFHHPETGNAVSVTAPLPSDFQEVLKKLRSSL